MKVMTFSRKFPRWHPRRGGTTRFVEQILDYLLMNPDYCTQVTMEQLQLRADPYGGIKSHTIRAGERWKPGDWFSPRVWSGRAYNSSQVSFAPGIEVKKVWGIEISRRYNKHFVFINGILQPDAAIIKVAENDGLSVEDFRGWFAKPFTGQIICWNPDIVY